MAPKEFRIGEPAPPNIFIGKGRQIIKRHDVIVGLPDITPLLDSYAIRNQRISDELSDAAPRLLLDDPLPHAGPLAVETSLGYISTSKKLDPQRPFERVLKHINDEQGWLDFLTITNTILNFPKKELTTGVLADVIGQKRTERAVKNVFRLWAFGSHVRKDETAIYVPGTLIVQERRTTPPTFDPMQFRARNSKKH